MNQTVPPVSRRRRLSSQSWPRLIVLVEQADALERRAPEARRGTRSRPGPRARRRGTPSRRGRPCVRVGAGDGLLERRRALGVHDAADVVGAACARARLDRDARVVGRQHRVRVDAHDDRVLERPDRRRSARRGSIRPRSSSTRMRGSRGREVGDQLRRCRRSSARAARSTSNGAGVVLREDDVDGGRARASTSFSTGMT